MATETDYTVKGVKSFRGMEGEGYNAALYRAGKKVAFVIDEGNGGEPHIEWVDFQAPKVAITHTLYDGKEHTYQGTPEEKILMELVNTLTWEYGGKKNRMTADIFVGDLISDVQMRKDFDRINKKNYIFITPSERKGAYRSIPRKHSPDVFLKYIKDKFPTYTIIDTFELWKKEVAI